MSKRKTEKIELIGKDALPSFKIQRKYKLTPKQQAFLQAANGDSKVLMIDGLWGTGKTSMAVYYALSGLKEGLFDGILYLRNPVEASNVSRMGYLKGDKEEKMHPYGMPGWDLLWEFLGESTSEFVKQGYFEVEAVSFIRGLNWDKKVVIVDEAENLSKEDILLVISRLKDTSKVILVGDNFQTDIRNSGFRYIFDLFSSEEDRENGIYTFEFKDESDIMRSGLLRYVMKKVLK